MDTGTTGKERPDRLAELEELMKEMEVRLVAYTNGDVLAKAALGTNRWTNFPSLPDVLAWLKEQSDA